MRNQIWALALAMMVGAMGISIANVALPDIARAFGVTAQGANRVSVVYLAAVTVAAVLVGRIGDWFGRGRVLRAALVGFAGASVLAALSPTMGALIAARAVQGVFGAALMVLSVGLVRQISGPTRSGRMVGALGSMSALGTATGPVIGGVLVDLSGWRACFWALAGLAAFAGMIARIPDGAASVQSGQGAPRGLWVGYLANLGVATVMMGTLVVGPFFLSFGAGLSARMVGVVMAVGPVMSIIGGVMAGRAVDRFGAGPVARLGSWLVALGSFMLALLSPVWGVLGVSDWDHGPDAGISVVSGRKHQRDDDACAQGGAGRCCGRAGHGAQSGPVDRGVGVWRAVHTCLGRCSRAECRCR